MKQQTIFRMLIAVWFITLSTPLSAGAFTAQEAADALYRYYQADKDENVQAMLDLTDFSHVADQDRTAFIQETRNLLSAMHAYYTTTTFELLDADIFTSDRDARIFYRLKSTLSTADGGQLTIDNHFVALLRASAQGWKVTYTMPRAAWEQRRLTLGYLRGLSGEMPDKIPDRPARPSQETGFEGTWRHEQAPGCRLTIQHAFGSRYYWTEQCKADTLTGACVKQVKTLACGFRYDNPAKTAAFATFTQSSKDRMDVRVVRFDGSPGGSSVYLRDGHAPGPPLSQPPSAADPDRFNGFWHQPANKNTVMSLDHLSSGLLFGIQSWQGGFLDLACLPHNQEMVCAYTAPDTGRILFSRLTATGDRLTYTAYHQNGGTPWTGHFIRMGRSVRQTETAAPPAPAAPPASVAAARPGPGMAGTWLVKREKAQIIVNKGDSGGFRFVKTYYHRGQKFTKPGRMTVQDSRIRFEYESGTRAAGKIAGEGKILESSTVLWEKVSDSVSPARIIIQGTWDAYGQVITLTQSGQVLTGVKQVGGKPYSTLTGGVDGHLIYLTETYNTIKTDNKPFHTLVFRDPDCLVVSSSRDGKDTCWTPKR